MRENDGEAQAARLPYERVWDALASGVEYLSEIAAEAGLTARQTSCILTRMQALGKVEKRLVRYKGGKSGYIYSATGAEP